MARLTHLPSFELKRFRSATLTKLALLAVVVVPLLYGALYLWSFWNPTGNLDHVPAALVVQDKPASVTSSDGKTTTLNAGEELAEKLPESDSLDWTITDAQEAARGLKQGKYLVIVTVPENFSANLVSPASERAEQANLELTTDDSNNYLIRQISNSVLKAIRENLAHEVTSEYVNNVYVSLSTLHNSTNDAADGANDVADGVDSADNGARELREGLKTLSSSSHQLANGASELDTGIGKLDTGANDLEAGLAKLDSGGKTLAQGLSTLDDKTASLPEQSRQLADGAQQVAEGTEQVNDVATKINKASDDIAEARQQLRDDLIADLKTQRDDAKNAGDQTTVEALDKAIAKAESVADRVDPKLQGIDSDLDEAAASTKKLAAGANKVADGAEKLAEAAPALHQGIKSASNGADQLSSGIHSASAGASALSDGAAEAKTGSAKLADGSTKLADGAEKATDGSGSLEEGLAKLSDGSHKLADSLADGAKKIPDYADKDQRSDVVANPVGQTDSNENKANTYGIGFAPYFIALAMWVGALVTYMVLKPLSPRLIASATNPVRVMWANYAPAALLSLGQTILMWLVLHFGLGITPEHPLGAFAMTWLGSLAFTALMQLFNAALGTPGRLLALAILMLQLTSAGGTYPIQTSPGLFQALHPYLPMTYLVSGLRVLISGGDMSRISLDVLVLAGVALGALALTALTARKQRMVTMKRLYPVLEV
ncbi:YhgE/Pip domain-containing protein [Saxibacter everestensis]|uniref:YhgE/Pip domain-containing protein n=1 Tax=Saxibacter everestensis TaxID=2909229 RepID=A0ABY8QW91_9MICO|nr:YhgE/Pip domain-containing protein [Brevibacteriaceae bacterium ZFBP1038]